MREIKRCPICKRSKNEAIQEQSALHVACGSAGCVFAKDITKAIEDKTKIKIVKKKKPEIKVIAKEKPKISIIKKSKWQD